MSCTDSDNFIKYRSSFRCWSMVFIEILTPQLIKQWKWAFQDNLMKCASLYLSIKCVTAAGRRKNSHHFSLHSHLLLSKGTLWRVLCSWKKSLETDTDDIFFNFLSAGTWVWPWGNGLVELPTGRPQSRQAAFQPERNFHKLRLFRQKRQNFHKLWLFRQNKREVITPRPLG